MTISPKQSLLDLPAELRNTIYELVLGQDNVIVLASCQQPPATLREDAAAIFHELRYHTRPPALTQACRQLRRETLPIYYGGNIFFCDQRAPMLRWLMALMAGQRDMLRRVRGWTIEPAYCPQAAEMMAQTSESALMWRGLALREGAIEMPYHLSEDGQPRQPWYRSRGRVAWVNARGEIRGTMAS